MGRQFSANSGHPGPSEVAPVVVHAIRSSCSSSARLVNGLPMVSSGITRRSLRLGIDSQDTGGPAAHARAQAASAGPGMKDEVCEVVITGPSQEWVTAFTRQLVDQRLAACGHSIDLIRSIYRWEDTVHDETEARVALHTRRSLVPAIVIRANQDHPYDIPCVIALPIVDGNPGYIDWVLRETAND